jgi:hypothetical protein
LMVDLVGRRVESDLCLHSQGGQVVYIKPGSVTCVIISRDSAASPSACMHSVAIALRMRSSALMIGQSGVSPSGFRDVGT